MNTKKIKSTSRLGRKQIWLIVIAMLLVGGAILLKMRWHAWFGNPAEAPYTTEDTIDRLTITPGASFASSRQVSWRCGASAQYAYLMYAPLLPDLPSDSLVWRRIPAEGKVISTRGGSGCYYTVSLDSLVAGQVYTYRVVTGDQSASGTFEMSSSLDSLTKFIYLGDVQDPSGELSGVQLRGLTTRVDSTFAPDFIATAGDQIEGPTDTYWQVWYDAWGSDYLARMPFIISTGNHEYLKRGFSRQLDERWVPQYNYPNNGPEGFEHRSYYIDFPLVRFIVLDSNGINSPLDIWRHRSWLKEVLGGSSQPWQIVMFHHAVRPVRDSRSHPVMQYIYQPILQEYGADLVLQGHDHAYSRITTKHEGDTITPVYVISSSSPKVYRNGFAPEHDRLGSGLQLYQTVEIRPEAIRYRSHLYSGDLYDDIEIRHSSEDKAHKVLDLAQDIPERFEFNAFGSSSKGQKKAQRYQEEVRQRLNKRLANE